MDTRISDLTGLPGAINPATTKIELAYPDGSSPTGFTSVFCYVDDILSLSPTPAVGVNEIAFGDQFTGELNSNSLFMRDPSTGWIGVNTNSPQAQAHFKGNSGAYAGKWDSGTGLDTYVVFDTSGASTNRHQQYLKHSDQTMNYYTVNGKTVFWNGTSGQVKTLTLNADSTVRFEGNVGIGGDPTARLNVEGGNVIFKRYGTNLNVQMDSDNTTEFDFKYNNTIKYALRADFGSSRQYYLGPNVTFIDAYQRIINGSGTTEIAYFDGVTNTTGFGTTTPTAKVDVRGQVVAGNGSGAITSNNAPFYASRASTGGPNYHTGWQYVYEVGGGIWGIGMNYPNNEFQFLTNGGSTAKFVFGSGNPTAPGTKFTMDLNSGYFGANTTSPSATITGKGLDSLATNFGLHILNGAGVSNLRVRNDGYTFTKVIDAAVADADVENNEMAAYLSEATNELIFKVKYSTGVVKTGSIALS